MGDGLLQGQELLWPVSILVFVELALDVVGPSRPPPRSSHVSILVFVELALDGHPEQCQL